MQEEANIHPTADVSPEARIAEGARIWQHAQVRVGAVVGRECVIGKGVYVGVGVSVGSRVKVQNYALIYEGVTLGDGVFVGPHVCFTNDRLPRAVNPDGSLKSSADWELTPTFVREGAAIGANSTVLCGTTIGRWAMVGAGSVVTEDVPDHGLVRGNPARLRGFVCRCGGRLECEDRADRQREGRVLLRCEECGRHVEIDEADWEALE